MLCSSILCRNFSGSYAAVQTSSSPSRTSNDRHGLVRILYIIFFRELDTAAGHQQWRIFFKHDPGIISTRIALFVFVIPIILSKLCHYSSRSI